MFWGASSSHSSRPKRAGEGYRSSLSISHGIVRAHGGEIRAQNRSEGGARFCFRTFRAARRTDKVTRMADTVILIIDDDPDYPPYGRQLFRRAGLRGGRDSTGEPDVDTYDRMRPDGGACSTSGCRGSGTACRCWSGCGSGMRGHPDHRQTEGVELRYAAMHARAENFLTKPVDLGHLGAVIAKAVDR